MQVKFIIGAQCRLHSKVFWCFFIMIAAVVTPLYSQEKITRFQHLTIEDGLAQNMVDCILRDSKGFMWFGTWNGLCRYDGYKFEVFNNEDGNIHSLRNNFIYALSEDQFGNIWVGTKEGLYLYLYDKHEFRFINKLLDNSTPLEGSITVIRQTDDKTIWIGTDTGAMQVRVKDRRGNVEKLQFYTFGEAPYHLSGSLVRAIFKANDGSIWIGTDEGVNILNPHKQTFSRYQHNPLISSSLSSDVIHCIYQDSKKRIWVGTEIGLNRFDSQIDGFVHYFHQPSNPASLPHNAVTDIVEAYSGHIFFSTLGGLSEYEGGNSFRNFKSALKKESSLNSDFVSCLWADKNGILWIGTERGGINIYDINQNGLEYFEYEGGNPNSLSHNTINSIYEDTRYIWIGTAGGGLNRYDKVYQTYKHYKHDANDPRSISSDFITAIHRDRKGRLWLATWGMGLNLMVEEAGDHQYFRNSLNSEAFLDLSNGFVSAIIEDQKGDLWIGTNGGLNKYSIDGQKFIRIAPEINEVGCLAFDNNQDLWAGTLSGLYYIKFDSIKEPHTGYQVALFKHDPLDGSSLSGNYITTIAKDSEGQMWFGTYGQGINKLLKENDKVSFKSFTKDDGISNNIIYGIIEDNEKKLWISTDNGLSRFDPQTIKFRNFYFADGLLNNQYYWSAYYKNDSGKLYFGGMNGLNTFYSSWLNNKPLPRKVVLTDLKVFNESVIPGIKYQEVNVLSENIATAKSVNLSYKSKVFSFEFSALDYKEPKLIKYAYYLEGFDDDWNYVNSNRRFANYTNLKPGDYTFMVKASDLNGDFTSPVTAIALHIAPPFWATWWFQTAAAIFIVALVIGYNRFRIYNLNTQKLLLERQVKERTEKIKSQNRELFKRAKQLKTSNKQLEKKQQLIEGQNEKLAHQNKHIKQQRNEMIKLNKKVKLASQLKLRFFTNVSHEFRTPLTLIIGPLEDLLRNNKLDINTKSTLQLINRNAQRLLHLINQIMDFRRIEKGKMELRITQGNIIEFCRNIFNAFQPLTETKKIKFNFYTKETSANIWFDHQKIENIVYNLLSNAFKYTPENGRIAMAVIVMPLEESRLVNKGVVPDGRRSVVSIKVADSGIGISQENIPLVFKQFYRIESEEVFQINGSGIGLTLAEELVKIHHGNIFVESTPGNGSTFEIQFPCLKEVEGEHNILTTHHYPNTLHKQVALLTEEFGKGIVEEHQKEPTATFDKDKLVVLLVEDNKDLRQFMAHRFKANYNVIEAENGKKGFEAAKKSNPDIIISDVMMPEMNGLELCVRIKSDLATSHIPLILLTAKSEVANKIEGLEKGADDYLPKPFDFDLLEARVKNLIETRKHLRNLFSRQSDLDLNQLATTNKDQKFLEKAIIIVENRMADPIFGVQEFVREIGVSRSLLHKKLSALTGQSATEFINHFRLKKSLKLLQQSDMNISEIAYTVGYNDPKYFSRIFSKQYGASPSEYLQKTMKVAKGLA